MRKIKVMEYLKRYIEKDIELALETSGVVAVAGPKFCGKTEMSSRFAKSKIALDEAPHHSVRQRRSSRNFAWRHAEIGGRMAERPKSLECCEIGG